MELEDHNNADDLEALFNRMKGLLPGKVDVWAHRKGLFSYYREERDCIRRCVLMNTGFLGQLNGKRF